MASTIGAWHPHDVSTARIESPWLILDATLWLSRHAQEEAAAGGGKLGHGKKEGMEGKSAFSRELCRPDWKRNGRTSLRRHLFPPTPVLLSSGASRSAWPRHHRPSLLRVPPRHVCIVFLPASFSSPSPLPLFLAVLFYTLTVVAPHSNN